MLEKLRALFRSRPRLDDADPVVRRRALDDIDDPAALAEVFRNDPDTELRRAAMARIEDLAFLEDCLNADDFPSWPLKNEVIARIREVAAPEALIRQHPYLIAATVAELDDAERAAATLKLVQNPNDLAQAILGHPRVKVRKSIAETVWNPIDLRSLEAQSRGHDKAVNRIAKARLASLKTARAAARECADEFAATIQAARALRDDDPHYESKRDAIDASFAELVTKARISNQDLEPFGESELPVNEWQSTFPARRIETVVPETPEPAAGPTEVPETSALEAETAEALDTEPEPKPGTEHEAVADEELNALATAVTELKDPPGTTLDDFELRLASIPAATSELREAVANHLVAFRKAIELDQDVTVFLGAANTETPDERDAPSEAAPPTLRDQRDAVRARAKRTKTLIRAYAWPDELQRPTLLTALIESARSCEEKLRRIDAEARECLSEINADLAALDAALEAGNVKTASALERQLRETVAQLPNQEARPVAAQLNDLSARLRRLRDWRDFAVGPKRIELIESMEALPANPDDVRAQADTVKALRKAWNELGPLTQRGSDKDLKERFDTAAEQAFEACRQHYEVLAEERKKNLDERRSIVALLEDYIAGPQWREADCRDIDKVLRTARSEWRRFHPVDRQAGRDVERAFNEATDTIFTTLKARWETHEKAKQNIIDRAELVATSDEPVDARARSIVDLQAEWKNAGPLPRHRDQKMYTRFRVHCDAVFQDRSHARAERDADFKAKEVAVKDLSARIRAIAQTTPVDQVMLRQLRAEADACEPLPRKLRNLLDTLFESVDAAIIASHLEQERHEHASLVQKIRTIDAEIEPACADWESRAGEAASWFTPRMTGAASSDDARHLTIEAEIAAELESPESDRQLRLQIQVEKLNTELGRIDRTKASSRDLLSRWCGAPVSDDAALRERFFDAVEKLATQD